MLRTTDDRRAWLGRFYDPQPIRRVGLFYLYNVEYDGERRVAAVGRPELDPIWADKVLDRVVEVHGLNASPHIPKVLEHGVAGDVRFIVFDLDAIHDGHHLRILVQRSGRKLAPGIGTAYALVLLDMLSDLETARDTEGLPVHCGGLSYCNLLITRTGHLAFIGVSTELLAHQGAGIQDYRAPEMDAIEAGQGTLTARQTSYSAGQILIDMLSSIEATPLERRLMLNPKSVDPKIEQVWRTFWEGCEAQDPALRPAGPADLRAAYVALCETLGKLPTPEGIGDYYKRALEREPNTLTTVLADRYRMDQQLRFGHRGELMLAWDLELEAPVAIRWRSIDYNPQIRQRLTREINLLRRIRHPNVVAGYDVVEHQGRVGAVLEYVPGDRLEALLKGTTDRLKLASTLSGIASALQHLHAQRVVHREVKPAHIVVNSQRGAVLVGLGLVRRIEPGAAPITLPSELVGTFRYMAPEQFDAVDVGPPIDVFGFGMTLLDVLAPGLGDHPAPALSLAALQAVPGISEILTQLIMRALDFDPTKRPPIETFAKALSDLTAPPPESRCQVALDGTWYEIDGLRVSLKRRAAQRLVLAALAERHLVGAPPMTWRDLLSVGWPGQQLETKAGRSRVYVMLSNLRGGGLNTFLENVRSGFKLKSDPYVSVITLN